MDKITVSVRSAITRLALGLVIVSTAASAQNPPEIFISGADRFLTFVGHNNEKARIVDTDGRVTEFNREELSVIHPVVPGPPRPEVPPAPEVVETISAPPAPETVDFTASAIRRELTHQVQQQLTAGAVPRLPDGRRPLFSIRASKDRAARVSETNVPATTLPATEPSIEEQDVLRAIGIDLIAQARPVLPQPFLFGPNAPRGRVSATSQGITLAEGARPAKRAIEDTFAERIVPTLSETSLARTRRTARFAVPRRGVAASEIQVALPLHLLQQPAPQLPASANKRNARTRVSK